LVKPPAKRAENDDLQRFRVIVQIHERREAFVQVVVVLVVIGYDGRSTSAVSSQHGICVCVL
jgi:hypothetical protein